MLLLVPRGVLTLQPLLELPLRLYCCCRCSRRCCRCHRCCVVTAVAACPACGCCTCISSDASSAQSPLQAATPSRAAQEGASAILVDPAAVCQNAVANFLFIECRWPPRASRHRTARLPGRCGRRRRSCWGPHWPRPGWREPGHTGLTPAGEGQATSCGRYCQGGAGMSQPTLPPALAKDGSAGVNPMVPSCQR